MSQESKNVTISDIAAYANVSRSTVSRVLNNVKTKVPVSANTRERIAEAIRHFDYQPNVNARRLSTSKSYIIGLQVPAHHLNNYVFSDYNLIGAMHGVEAALLHTDYKLLLLFQSENYMKRSEYLTLLKNRSIDGLLIWGALRDDRFDDGLKNYPVFFLNTIPDEHQDFNFLCHDDYHAAYDLTCNIIGQGARRFRYLKGPDSNSITVNRYRGFLAALQEHQLPFDTSRLSFGDFHRESAREVFAEFLNVAQLDFDAVICSNDMMATGIYELAQQTRHRPGRDFHLAGGDGVEDCERYQLPTFKVDRFEMGFRGVNQLISCINQSEKMPCIQQYIKVK